MSNLSKYTFDKCVTTVTPCSIFHPWNSNCFGGLLVFATNVFLGSTKFFLPIYIVKLMLNYKKINQRKFVEEQILGYLRSVAYGVSFGSLFLISCCTISKIWINYFIVMQAGAVGALSLLIESTENKNMDKILFFNQLIEIFINVLTSKRIIIRNRWTETLAFMLVTSNLMYLFKTRKIKQKIPLLWFYPERSIYNVSEKRNGFPLDELCQHKKSCFDYSLDGGYNFFFIGYLLEIVRKFLPKMYIYVNTPKLIPLLLLHKDNLMMGSFLGGFVFIYRSIRCYFQQKERKELPSHTLIAALIASGTYVIKPNIQIFIIALTTTLQLLWEKFSFYFNLPKKISYSQLLFCISGGILLHYRIMMPDQCPKYVKNMVDIATNNMSTTLQNRFFADIKEIELFMDGLNKNI
nr:transmembrane protein 135-like [Onthophagus taurus]